ncbi:MAG TPA: hypothetical protein DET40_06620 [Lentisphaeria bacterium]|nr:MAG: hypothetical protein A2X45_17505 [Lentisphaerae bacterium GWF2_50_93]HCE43202.1 hypothetical protein [Lentisphaeria bacterium]
MSDKNINFPESDFTVVGASFAGSLLASKLARHGKVLLIDKREPGSRLKCGGGVRTREFNRLGLDIPHVKAEKILMSEKGRIISFNSKYAVVDRMEFDAAVFQKALDAGAVFQKAEYLSHEAAKNIMSVRIGEETIEYKYRKLILAKGFHLDPGDRFYGASYVEIVEGSSRHGDALYFDLLQKNVGYCWLFPLPGGRVNIGIGSLSGEPFSREDFRSFKEEQGITGKVICKGGGMIPLVPAMTVMKDSVYLFGDSAGMVFSANGEGIRNIIKMSDIWADCIVKGKNLNIRWITNRTFIRLCASTMVVKAIASTGRFGSRFYNFLSRTAALARSLLK